MILTVAALFLFSTISGCGLITDNGMSNTAEITAGGSSSTDSSSSAISYDISDFDYTKEDLSGTWDDDGAVSVTLDDTYTIFSAGTYVFTGTLDDGQLIVDAGDGDTVQIVLDSASITSSTGPAINIANADKVIITLADGTENVLTDSSYYVLGEGEDEPNAAIFSHDDLTINGTGALTVNANYEDGIVSKDDLVITGGLITITAADDCIRGKDCVAICGGTFVLTAGGDGIKSTEDSNSSKGFVRIDGGTFTIDAAADGIQAETVLQITGGEISLVTGEGSDNASTDANGNADNSWGTWGRQDGSQTDETETADSAKGLKAAGDLIITGGAIEIDSSDDSIHSNGNVTISGGTINLSSGTTACMPIPLS
jgi:hypothetical protein